MYIVHLSDLHFHDPSSVDSHSEEEIFSIKRYQGLFNLKYGRGYGSDDLFIKAHQTALKHIQNQNPDQSSPNIHWIVTGDVTNIALRSEYAYCRRMFNQIIFNNSQSQTKISSQDDSKNIPIGGDLKTKLSLHSSESPLSPLPYEEITIIPGNHDMYVDSSISYFMEYFRDACFHPSEQKQYHDLSLAQDKSQFPFVKTLPIDESSQLCMIGFNSGKPTNLFVAAGTIDEAQWERAEKVMEYLYSLQQKNPNIVQFRVLLVHHPPHTRYNRFIEWMGMLDEPSKRRLKKFCKTHQIDLILNGHTHEAHVSLLNRTLVIDAGSTTMKGKRKRLPAFNIYHVENGGIQESWHFEWKQKEGFVSETMELPDSLATMQDSFEVEEKEEVTSFAIMQESSLRIM